MLGAATLAQLHKHLGDTVEVHTGAAESVRLRIVGTATLPSLGVSGTLHTEMGTGALLSYQLIPGAASSQPNNILVTLRPGANPATALRTLQQLVPASNGGDVASVQRPAEIVNYRSMGTTPAFLGAALATGAITALGLTLIASVRRRRRDLALLKTLGFTRRQLAAAVAWQSSVAVAAGSIIGVPVGIALGRFLWDLFARQIDVVPQPARPRCHGHPHHPRGARARQHRRRPSRARRGPHSHSTAATSRMTDRIPHGRSSGLAVDQPRHNDH